MLSFPVAAQPDHFTSSPEGFDSIEGGSDSRDLLGTQPRLRYQQIDSTNGDMSNRNRMAFRRDGWLIDNPQYVGRTIDLEIVFSESKLLNISTSFAANYTANTTTVVTRKQIVFDDWTVAPALPPAQHSTPIWLDQVWSYAGKAATGNDFLWEVRVFANTEAGKHYPFDFDFVVPSATFGTPVPTRGATTNLSAGCAVAMHGGARHQLTATVLNHRTRFEISGTSIYGPPSAPTVLMIDAVNLGIVAPGLLCNPLHAAALAIPLGSSEATVGGVNIAIPNIPHVPSVIGGFIYMQTIAPDFAQTGLPLSLSNGVRAQVPTNPPRPAIGRVWALDPGATQATVGPVPGGIIIFTNHL